MSSDQAQRRAAELAGPDPAGKSVWEGAKAAHEAGVPSDAWEYHMRAALQDAAYTSLAYAPACTHAPTCTGACPRPVWVWKRK